MTLDDTANPTVTATSPAKPNEPTYLDNRPACGAPKNWQWGYLPCGCRNDGYGRHIR